MTDHPAVRTEACRICGSSLQDVLDLGLFAPSDFVREQTDEERVPLTLAQCDACALVQLRHTIDRDKLYRQYWYLSGLNRSMVDALRDVVTGVTQRICLQPGDVVVDVGANDGTLLSLYNDDVLKIGFDPARNLAEQAEKVCDRFYNDYFETSAVELPKIKVLTSIAMFYDLNEPWRFVEKVRQALTDDGLWVVQMTDLVRMLRANAFDNVCHEHLCYYSLGQFKLLVEAHGLEVFDVEFNDVNGGSLRAYVGIREAHEVQPSVERSMADETAYLGDNAIANFADRVQSAKKTVVEFIEKERALGKRFHALGASTKGNTLLQYFGIGSKEIEVAAEVNSDKFGLRTAGSDIPIVSEAQSFEARPDYYLVLPWHFIQFLRARADDYLKTGGVLLSPLPTPRLHYHDHATDL